MPSTPCPTCILPSKRIFLSFVLSCLAFSQIASAAPLASQGVQAGQAGQAPVDSTLLSVIKSVYNAAEATKSHSRTAAVAASTTAAQPKLATTTKSVPGLTSNSATSTTVGGIATVLPIWFAGAGVGIIVVPAVPVPGLIPPPVGKAPLSVGPDGKPTHVDKDGKPKSVDEGQAPSPPASSHPITPTPSSHSPVQTSSANPQSSVDACPKPPSVSSVPLMAPGSVRAAQSTDTIYAQGLAAQKSNPPPVKTSQDPNPATKFSAIIPVNTIYTAPGPVQNPNGGINIGPIDGGGITITGSPVDTPTPAPAPTRVPQGIAGLHDKRQGGSSQEGEWQYGAISLVYPDDDSDPAHQEPQEEFLEAGTSDLRANGYEVTAELSGIWLVTVSGNLLDVREYLQKEPDLRAAKWAGDHIYELGLFVKFLKSKPEYAPILTDILQSCIEIQVRFKGILNSPSNLISVDAGVNNLKMVYLQTNGPQNFNSKSPAVFWATRRYLQQIQGRYMAVAESLGDALEQVSQGLPGGVSQGIKSAFTQYSSQLFNTALTKLAQYTPPGQGFVAADKYVLHSFSAG